MHYGHPPHNPSPEDLTVLECRTCGWSEPRLNSSLGVPWYCDKCGERVYHFITYHPSEETVARAIMGQKV